MRYVYHDEATLPSAVIAEDGARHNTAPVVDGAGGRFIISEAPDAIGPVKVFQAVRVQDPDHQPFKGGELTVNFLDGIASQPLSFDFATDARFAYDEASGAISYQSPHVAGASVIGFLDSSSGSSLHVTFTKNASSAAVEALIQSVAYGAADFDLPTNSYCALGFVLIDAKGAAVQGAMGVSEFDWHGVALTGIQSSDAGLP